MHSARRYLLIALTFTLAIAVITVCSPRVAHAVTAALVQVTNPPSNPVMVRSVDEPARVPYFVSGKPNCPFTNECLLVGTTVPAGMRLRITHINGWISANVSGFAALSVDTDTNVAVMLPLTAVDGAFFFPSIAFNQEVDFYVDEGHTPELQVGSAGSIYQASFQSMTITGYLVNKQP